jgi:xanthine dehydrogenase accessory factor
LPLGPRGKGAMDIFNTILSLLRQGSHGVLATVVRRTGSAPRDVGSKMLVTNEGRVFGTVGGGQLESEAYGKATEMMGGNATVMLHVDMDAVRVEDRVMLCGGSVDILLEPVTRERLAVYEAVGRCVEDRERAITLTRFGPRGFAKSLIRGDGTVIGDHVDQQAADRCVELINLSRSELSEETFAEPVRITVPLYIFGAGHVSQHLSKIAKAAGFFVTVIDDRKEFANVERFSEADAIVTGQFRDVFSSLDFTGNEYVAIVTRSQEQDALVLEEVLKRSAKYVGMMGSTRKIGIILDSLHEKGLDRETTSRVHAPIGLGIDAETPQEVAVSIVAEMIKVKNAKH